VRVSGTAKAVAERKRRFRMPMATLLGLAYGALTFVSLAFVLGLTAFSNYSNTFALLNENSILTMQTLSEQVEAHMRPGEDAVRGIATLYRDEEIRLETMDDRASVAAGVLATSDVFDALVFYDRDFRYDGMFRDAEGALHRIETNDVKQPEVREALSRLNPETQSFWGTPVFVENDSFINVGAPLVRNGVISGYIVAAVSTAVLSDAVRNVEAAGGTNFILYGPNAVFAHSKGRELGLQQKLGVDETVIPLQEAGDPVLAKLHERDLFDNFQKAADAGVEVGDVELDDGEAFVVMTKEMPQFGPVPWIVGRYQPQEEVIAEIRRLYGSITIALLSIAVSVVVAVLIGRRVARSLDRLHEVAGHIERFEIDEAPELPRSRIAELDDVSTAVNGMLSALKAFAVYVPRSLVRRLVRLGFQEATRLHERQGTILFTDIIGFTALSETMSAEEVARLLNEHFSLMVRCVEEHQGTVDKFMGDGVMAVWVGDDPETGAACAARTAVAMAKCVKAEAAKARAAGRTPLRVRIGLHFGPVIVGNLGAADRVNYTIIGDTVNVASRLEALGKTVAPDDDVVILASAETIDAMTHLDPTIRWADVGTTVLRGRSGAVDVRRILPDGDTAPPATLAAE
jgi:adenylate cyclase